MTSTTQPLPDRRGFSFVYRSMWLLVVCSFAHWLSVHGIFHDTIFDLRNFQEIMQFHARELSLRKVHCKLGFT